MKTILKLALCILLLASFTKVKSQGVGVFVDEFEEQDPPFIPVTPNDRIAGKKMINDFVIKDGSNLAQSYTLSGKAIYDFIEIEKVNTICVYNGIYGADELVFIVFPVELNGTKYKVKTTGNCLVFPKRCMCFNNCSYQIDLTRPAPPTITRFSEGQEMVETYKLNAERLDIVRGYLLQRSTLYDLIDETDKFDIRIYNAFKAPDRCIVVTRVGKNLLDAGGNNFQVLNHKALCPNSCDILKRR